MAGPGEKGKGSDMRTERLEARNGMKTIAKTLDFSLNKM